MGITGLLPFIEKASRRTNISEFSGCTVAIDSYCWLHKGAFACADKLVRGEETDIHIRYCLKYVNMLLSKNVKPVLVFDGRHLPAKAMTESKRRESRNISKKRAAELLSLGKVEEARSYMRRSVDITHEMALSLIRECRARNVDCIVAPYEADSQLAYLNIKNIAHVVITEDSDLILFGCSKVLFKMDLNGTGTLVETAKLPLVMKCPIEQYSFDKFRQMCVMSGCDYLASLPGIGLAKARQFVTATQDSNFANALKKLPSFFNRSNLTVTDEYRANFLKAEATFKHQYVYDPLARSMVRLTEPDDEDVEKALCVNAGELLDPKVAFQLALGNLDPFTLKKMDDWHPDHRTSEDINIKTSNWNDKGISSHPSMWSADFQSYLDEPCPWQKKAKVSQISAFTRQTRRVVNLVSKVVPETQDQDESLSIQSLSSMYCVEPLTKRQKTDESQLKQRLADEDILNEIKKEKSPSPILKNKERSFKKGLRNGSYSILKRLSRFPRTVIGDNVVESKFFTSNCSKTTSEISKTTSDISKTTSDISKTTSDISKPTSDISKTTIDMSETTSERNSILVEESPEKCRNPFRKSEINVITNTSNNEETTEEEEANISIVIEESPVKSRNPFKKSIYSNTSTDYKSNVSENNILIEETLFINSIDNDETICTDLDNDETICTDLDNSQKENSPCNSPLKTSPVLEQSPRRNTFKSVLKNLDKSWSQDSVIENTYPMEMLVTPVDSQESFGESPPKSVLSSQPHRQPYSQPYSQPTRNHVKKATCRVPGLKKTASLPSNQPTLLSKFGFQKKPAMKR